MRKTTMRMMRRAIKIEPGKISVQRARKRLTAGDQGPSPPAPRGTISIRLILHVGADDVLDIADLD